MRKKAKFLEIYLYFSVFGAIKIIMDDHGLTLFTPFHKVQKFLNEHLEVNVVQQSNIEPLFVFKRFYDVKG